MKNTNEIRNNYNDNFEAMNTKNTNNTNNAGNSGISPEGARWARQRKVALIQKNRKKKAIRQRIIAVFATSVLAAGIAGFCIFGIPAINKSASAPAAQSTTVSQTASNIKKTSQAKTTKAVNTDSKTTDNSNYVAPVNSYDNGNSNTYTADTNTSVYTNTNTNTNTNNSASNTSEEVNYVKPYGGTVADNTGNGSIGDTKTNPNYNPKGNKVEANDAEQPYNTVQPYNGGQATNNTNTVNTVKTVNNTSNADSADVNYVQPFVG